MPRKKSTKGAESKETLVITLVFFVLLSLSLGVGTYLGFAGQQDLESKRKNVQKDLEAMKQAREWEKFQKLVFKAYLGELSKDDEEAAATLRGQWEKGQVGKGEKDKEEVEKLIKQMDEKFGLDPATKKLARNYKETNDRVSKEFEAERKKIAEFAERDKKYEEDVARRVEDQKKERKQIEEEITKAQNNLVKEKGEKSRALIDSLAEQEKLSQKLEEITKQIEEDRVALKQKIDKLEHEKADLEKIIAKLRQKATPIDLTAYDVPKGKIVSLDRTGTTAYVNLGSADNVKPQLTFSIYPAGTAKAKGERKACLEVVDVLQPHLSSARITEVHDSNRDPVVTGDLLFNPAWNPNMQQRVAVAGLIDLTGDGKDDGMEFMRSLEKQGVAIDSYLDLKDLTVKGKMTYKTDYLVLGEIPEIDQDAALRVDDPRNARIKEIIVKLSEYQNEAARLGITIMPARRFMTLIGYKMPRTIKAPDYSLPAGVMIGAPAGGGEAKEKEPKEGKDEKAPPMEKEEKDADKKEDKEKDADKKEDKEKDADKKKDKDEPK